MSFNTKAQLLKTLLSNYCIRNVKLNKKEKSEASLRQRHGNQKIHFLLMQLDFYDDVATKLHTAHFNKMQSVNVFTVFFEHFSALNPIN